MTKEKAIDYLDNYRKLYADIAPERFLEALDVLLSESPLPSNLDEAAEEYAQDETMSGLAERAFKAGAEWQRERMEDEHGKELLYVCQKTAEREHRSGVREGKAQAEKELIPLINRLCEAILFEWKDAADLARKTLTQIKAKEEEK